MTYFDAAIESENLFFWPYYEKALLLHEAREAFNELASTIDRLIAVNPADLNRTHIKFLEAVGHTLFEEDWRELGGDLFAYLVDHGYRDSLSILSLTRSVETARHFSKREETVDYLLERHRDDKITSRVLLNLFKRNNDASRGFQLTEYLLENEPNRFDVFLEWAKWKVRIESSSGLDQITERAARFPLEQQSFLKIILSIEAGLLCEAKTQFIRHTRIHQAPPMFPGIRLGYMLLEAGDLSSCKTIVKILEEFFPDRHEAGLVGVHLALREHNLEEAERIYEKALEPSEKHSLNVRLARIDILAMTGRLDEAVQMLRNEKADGRLPASAIVPALRLYSEVNQWEEVFELGKEAIDVDASFDGIITPVIRAARKLARSKELLEYLNALEDKSAAIVSAVGVVTEDLVGDGEKVNVIDVDLLQLSKYREKRLAYKSFLRIDSTPVQKKRCIFYCVDGSYLLPALVSITSLIVNNIIMVKECVIAIMAEESILQKAARDIEILKIIFGVRISTYRAEKVIPDQTGLVSEYGIVTGGHSLSLAAYYRIFFAQFCARESLFDQLLYIDADTIVRGSLADLFDLDMAKCLMARAEVERPEVRLAAKNLSLRSRYFNSGVLRIDLKNEAVIQCLERAIHAAVSPDIKLYFQDQCALNLGFDGNYAPLPERFNFFVTPDVGEKCVDDGAVILHFLDRPKPWDGLYRKRADAWFEWYATFINLTRTRDRRTASSNAIE